MTKCKAFVDTQLEKCGEISENNREKVMRNSVATYVLKKMRKYDAIIIGRWFKIKTVLALIQRR